MNKAILLKKLESIIDEAERAHLFGTIEIELRDGHATVLRTLKTERLGENPPSHVKPAYR